MKLSLIIFMKCYRVEDVLMAYIPIFEVLLMTCYRVEDVLMAYIPIFEVLLLTSTETCRTKMNGEELHFPKLDGNDQNLATGKRKCLTSSCFRLQRTRDHASGLHLLRISGCTTSGSSVTMPLATGVRFLVSMCKFSLHEIQQLWRLLICELHAHQSSIITLPLSPPLLTCCSRIS